jgi:tyrosine-protein kinase Etk/Wzc
MAYNPQAPGDDRPLVQGEDEGISIADLIENLLHFWWVFVGVLVACVALATAYAIIAPPIYQSDVLIEVEPQKGSALGALTDVEGLLAGGGRSGVAGEIEILRSRAVVGRAIEASGADLEIRVLGRLPLVGEFLARRSEPGPDGLVSPLFPGPDFAWGGEQLIFDEFVVPDQLRGVRFTLIAASDGQWSLLDESEVEILRGDVGQLREAFKGALRVRVTSLRAVAGTRFAVKRHPVESEVREVVKALSAREASRQSNVIRAALEDTDATRAAHLLNAIAEAYVERNVGRRSEEAQKSLAFLREQLPKLREQLEASESQLNSFRNSQTILDVTAEIRSLLERTVAIETQRAELELKRQELSLRYESAHPALRAVDSQLFALRSEAERTTREVRGLPSREQQFLQLSRDVQVNTQLYVSLLNNAQQLEIARAGTVGNVAVVDRAVAAAGPLKPNKQRTVALGGFAGLVLGFLASQLLAAITGVIRDPKRLERLTGLPVVAIIPRSVEQQERGEAEGGHFLVSERYGAAPTSEALRSLRTAVLFTLSERNGKTVLVTSATPAQGKSFVSANLAYLLASGGRKVLLIDADIRRRSMPEYLAIPSDAAGVTEILRGVAKPDQCTLPEIHPNLWVLPAGAPVRNPGDLFTRRELSELLAWAVANHDYLVIDSAPLMLVSDAGELARYANETLFVVRQNEATSSEVRDALAALRRAGGTGSSLVFNGYAPSRIRYGYRYGYGYGYGYGPGYGARYSRGREGAQAPRDLVGGGK